MDPQAPEFIEKAEQFFCRSCDFFMGVAKTHQLPDTRLPEVVFAGRSNVGKSSLINALVNRKNLARTSKTPGRTQEINFFNLGNSLHIVDLPGYGYAQVSKSKTSNWNDTILVYLKGRPQLKRVFLLIDSRHGIMGNDEKIMTLLDTAAVSYQIVLTKIDKLKKSEQDAVVHQTQHYLSKHPAAHPCVLPTSAEKKSGLSLLRGEIFSFVA